MKNGLYSIHVQLGDGRDGKGSGILVFKDGVILGGDAYLFYTGKYSAEGSTVRGEVVVNEHTPRILTPIRSLPASRSALGFRAIHRYECDAQRHRARRPQQRDFPRHIASISQGRGHAGVQPAERCPDVGALIKTRITSSAGLLAPFMYKRASASSKPA